MKSLSKILVSFLFLFLVSCGGGGASNQQMSGVIAEANFSTAVGQPVSKIVNIRNEDTAEPQRVQSLAFEQGTNPTGFFTISKAVIGSTEYSGANLTNLVIHAGGTLSIYTTYNPRPDTRGNIVTSAEAYISLFLNGPRLGIPQVKLNGTTDPNSDVSVCGEEMDFKVDEVKLYVKQAGATSDPEPVSFSDADSHFTHLKIDVSGSIATISKINFPTLSFTPPGGTHPYNAAPVQNSEGVTPDAKSFNFDNFTIKVAGAIDLVGKLTTGAASASNGGLSISKTGSPLDSSNKMTLVFTAPIPNDAVSGITEARSLVGAVIAAEIKVTKQ